MNGTDIINVTWISPYGIPLEQSTHTAITTDASPTGVISSLHITNIQWPADHGFYTCRALADNFTETTSVEAVVHLHIQGTYNNAIISIKPQYTVQKHKHYCIENRSNSKYA